MISGAVERLPNKPKTTQIPLRRFAFHTLRLPRPKRVFQGQKCLGPIHRKLHNGAHCKEIDSS